MWARAVLQNVRDVSNAGGCAEALCIRRSGACSKGTNGNNVYAIRLVGELVKAQGVREKGMGRCCYEVYVWWSVLRRLREMSCLGGVHL